MNRRILNAALVTIALSQNACIVSSGVGTGAFTALGGTLAALTGAGMVDGCKGDSIACPIFASLLLVGGLALDGENPGRSESLNWLPVDEANAKKLSTHVQALEAYNDELGQIIRANDAIERDLGPIVSGKATEIHLSNLARTVGMTDSAELKRVLSGERLSRDHLKRFADQYSMSEETARIYLKLRFAIKTTD